MLEFGYNGVFAGDGIIDWQTRTLYLFLRWPIVLGDYCFVFGTSDTYGTEKDECCGWALLLNYNTFINITTRVNSWKQ